MAEIVKPKSTRKAFATIVILGFIGLFIDFNIVIWVMWGIGLISAIVFALYSRSNYTNAMRRMQSSIRINDIILTASGLVGKVVGIGGDCFIIEFDSSKDIHIPVLKSEIEARRRVA